jgi:hypothetical protein
MNAVAEQTMRKRAGKFQIQKENSNYNTIQEVDAIFKSLFVDSGLTFEVSTIKFYKANFAIPSKNGIASTNQKIKTMCKKAGIGVSTYYAKVVPDILGKLGEEIIEEQKTLKMQANGEQLNNGTPYRYLKPSFIIKSLIRRAQIKFGIIQSESPMESPMESPIEPSIPCESKDESPKKTEHALNILKDYKPLRDNTYNRLRETDSIFPQPKKYGIKKEVKEILQQDILIGLNDEQRQEFANRIQIALKRTGANIKDPDILNAIFEGCYGFVIKYEKNPENLTGDYYGALYVCIENAIYDCMIFDEVEEAEEFDYTGEYDHEGTHGYNGEYYHENMRREFYKEQKRASYIVDVIGDGYQNAQEAPQGRETVFEYETIPY